jgi:hypothetical protein
MEGERDHILRTLERSNWVVYRKVKSWLYRIMPHDQREEGMDDLSEGGFVGLDAGDHLREYKVAGVER